MDNISLSYFDTAIIYQIDYIISFTYVLTPSFYFIFHHQQMRGIKLLHGALIF